VNPQVYMDIKIGNKPAGRLRFVLRADIVPMTAGLCATSSVSFQLHNMHLIKPTWVAVGIKAEDSRGPSRKTFTSKYVNIHNTSRLIVNAGFNVNIADCVYIVDIYNMYLIC